MAKEILCIPEEHLKEVVLVIRVGLEHSGYLDIVGLAPSDRVVEQLSEWCDQMGPPKKAKRRGRST